MALSIKSGTTMVVPVAPLPTALLFQAKMWSTWTKSAPGLLKWNCTASYCARVCFVTFCNGACAMVAYTVLCLIIRKGGEQCWNWERLLSESVVVAASSRAKVTSTALAHITGMNGKRMVGKSAKLGQCMSRFSEEFRWNRERHDCQGFKKSVHVFIILP